MHMSSSSSLSGARIHHLQDRLSMYKSQYIKLQCENARLAGERDTIKYIDGFLILDQFLCCNKDTNDHLDNHFMTLFRFFICPRTQTRSHSQSGMSWQVTHNNPALTALLTQKYTFGAALTMIHGSILPQWLA
jgi:hypothetical protein